MTRLERVRLLKRLDQLELAAPEGCYYGEDDYSAGQAQGLEEGYKDAISDMRAIVKEA